MRFISILPLLFAPLFFDADVCNGCIMVNGLMAANTNDSIHLTKTADSSKSSTPVFQQYYRLQKALEKYRCIDKAGGWEIITCDGQVTIGYKSISQTVASVRKRLFCEGYLTEDSKSSYFDEKLLAALIHYNNKHNLKNDSTITNMVITSMNISVKERIRTIEINMERCRLIEPEDYRTYVAVNIPAFKLYYFREGKLLLESKVVVGKEATKTVVFNGMMDQIIFSPYWNIPASIAQKEILPAVKRYPALFSQMRLEWHNGKLRQRPGASNALGLVKFVFPNSNNIYLHDTPLKAYFKEQKRAFSHGCIRVEKACELAASIMEHDYGWNEARTQSAMTSGKQKAYPLTTPIPVYIAYFTTWADEEGTVAFYPDIYKHDEKLAELLFSEKMTQK